MGVTSIGGHTHPDCNAKYDVRIKLVETWLFVCLTWQGNFGRLFVMVLHVILTPMKSWTLIGQFRSLGLNTRFWLVVPPSSDYYYSRESQKCIYRLKNKQTSSTGILTYFTSAAVVDSKNVTMIDTQLDDYVPRSNQTLRIFNFRNAEACDEF